MKRHLLIWLLLVLSTSMFCLGATFKQDGVTLEVTLTPDRVELERDIEMRLALTAPKGVEARLPESFTDRLEGLVIEGSYQGETVDDGALVRRVFFLRLRPVPGADLYRIAPFAVTYSDNRWFATKPMVLPLLPLRKEGEARLSDLDVSIKKVWVWPRLSTVARYFGYGVAGALFLGGVWQLFRWIRRRIRLARMAPRERALWELKELLERQLPQKGKVKEFYVALTHIVRRYIERRYSVRAPEQTTEEFLQEATHHPAFTPETLTRLREFLAAADMVKFAGITVTAETVADSTAAAKRYLENEKIAKSDSKEE